MPGSTRSYEMARRLVSWGHEVNMITSWRQGGKEGRWFQTEEEGIHVYWYPVRYSNHLDFWGRIKAFSEFSIHASIRAATLSADVVFATSTPLTIAVPGLFAAKKLDVPMVFEVRDLWPELPIAIGALDNLFLRYASLWMERLAYRNSAQIVALSDEIAKGVKRTGYPPYRVHIIPNSSDLDFFSCAESVDSFRAALPGLGEHPLLTYAGTLGEINGVSYLVEIAAAAKSAAPGLRFLVVGDGKEADSIKEKAASFEVLNNNFYMLPQVSKLEMPRILEASDVALSLFIDLEAMWGNSANKFFDALAAGKPVAINYGGWQAELLRESGAGIRIPANDPSAAAKQLGDWVSDRESLRQAGLAARQLAEKRFDRDKLAKELERVLDLAVKR